MIRTVVLTIGNELLAGIRVNTNVTFLGQELSKIGLPLHKALIVRDEEDEIRKAIDNCLPDYSIIITTGGLGPTSDDITKKVIASYFGKTLLFDEQVWSAITERFAKRGIEVPAINRSQAEIPEGFLPLRNSLGTAPGLLYEKEDSVLIMLPGVPYEMRALYSESVKPLLIKKYGNVPVVIKTLHTISIPESVLSEKISDITIPERVELSYIPSPGRVDLMLRGSDEAVVNRLFDLLKKRCSEHLWGVNEESLQKYIAALLQEKKLSLSLAESCTGGLIQKLLTDIPGASVFFAGGVTAYNDRIKTDLLEVDPEILKEKGAVSEETVRAMAEGVRKLFNSDIGGAVTGIAGPEGGTVEKPVGTVWFSVSSGGLTVSARRVFSGDREAIRESSAMFLLNMIREVVSKAGNRGKVVR